jgi:hypothetical protein
MDLLELVEELLEAPWMKKLPAYSTRDNLLQEALRKARGEETW